MKSFKKKEGKRNPEISTASLPDIIFILLFFFMVATVIKDSELLVKISMPEISEVQKLNRQALVNNIYIGEPIKKYATKFKGPRIQLNDQFAEVEDVQRFIKSGKSNITTTLEVDKHVEMGIVNDVKIELRKAEARKLSYRTFNRKIQ